MKAGQGPIKVCDREVRDAARADYSLRSNAEEAFEARKVMKILEKHGGVKKLTETASIPGPSFSHIQANSNCFLKRSIWTPDWTISIMYGIGLEQVFATSMQLAVRGLLG